MRNINPIFVIFAFTLVFNLTSSHEDYNSGEEKFIEEFGTVRNARQSRPEDFKLEDLDGYQDKHKELGQLRVPAESDTLVEDISEIAKHIVKETSTHAELSEKPTGEQLRVSDFHLHKPEIPPKRQTDPEAIVILNTETVEDVDRHSCPQEAQEYGHDHEAGAITHELLCEVKKLEQYSAIAQKNLRKHLSESPKGNGDYVTITSEGPVTKEDVLNLLNQESLMEPENLIALSNLAQGSVPVSQIQATLRRIKSNVQKLIILLQDIIERAFSEHPEVLELIQQKMSELENAFSQVVPEFKKLLTELTKAARAIYQGYLAAGSPDFLAKKVSTVSSSMVPVVNGNHNVGHTSYVSATAYTNQDGNQDPVVSASEVQEEVADPFINTSVLRHAAKHVLRHLITHFNYVPGPSAPAAASPFVSEVQLDGNGQPQSLPVNNDFYGGILQYVLSYLDYQPEGVPSVVKVPTVSTVQLPAQENLKEANAYKNDSIDQNYLRELLGYVDYEPDVVSRKEHDQYDSLINMDIYDIMEQIARAINSDEASPTSLPGGSSAVAEANLEQNAELKSPLGNEGISGRTFKYVIKNVDSLPPGYLTKEELLAIKRLNNEHLIGTLKYLLKGKRPILHPGWQIPHPLPGPPILPVPRPQPGPHPLPGPPILPVPRPQPGPHPLPGPPILPVPRPQPGPHPRPSPPKLPGPHPLPSPPILPVPRPQPGPHPLPSPPILPVPHPQPGPHPLPSPPKLPGPHPQPGPHPLPSPPKLPGPHPQPGPHPLPSPPILPVPHPQPGPHPLPSPPILPVPHPQPGPHPLPSPPKLPGPHPQPGPHPLPSPPILPVPHPQPGPHPLPSPPILPVPHPQPGPHPLPSPPILPVPHPQPGPHPLPSPPILPVPHPQPGPHPLPGPYPQPGGTYSHSTSSSYTPQAASSSSTTTSANNNGNTPGGTNSLSNSSSYTPGSASTSSTNTGTSPSGNVNPTPFIYGVYNGPVPTFEPLKAPPSPPSSPHVASPLRLSPGRTYSHSTSSSYTPEAASSSSTATSANNNGNTPGSTNSLSDSSSHTAGSVSTSSTNTGTSPSGNVNPAPPTYGVYNGPVPSFQPRTVLSSPSSAYVVPPFRPSPGGTYSQSTSSSYTPEAASSSSTATSANNNGYAPGSTNSLSDSSSYTPGSASTSATNTGTSPFGNVNPTPFLYGNYYGTVPSFQQQTVPSSPSSPHVASPVKSSPGGTYSHSTSSSYTPEAASSSSTTTSANNNGNTPGGTNSLSDSSSYTPESASTSSTNTGTSPSANVNPAPYTQLSATAPVSSPALQNSPHVSSPANPGSTNYGGTYSHSTSSSYTPQSSSVSSTSTAAGSSNPSSPNAGGTNSLSDSSSYTPGSSSTSATETGTSYPANSANLANLANPANAANPANLANPANAANPASPGSPANPASLANPLPVAGSGHYAGPPHALPPLTYYGGNTYSHSTSSSYTPNSSSTSGTNTSAGQAGTNSNSGSSSYTPGSASTSTTETGTGPSQRPTQQDAISAITGRLRGRPFRFPIRQPAPSNPGTTYSSSTSSSYTPTSASTSNTQTAASNLPNAPGTSSLSNSNSHTAGSASSSSTETGTSSQVQHFPPAAVLNFNSIPKLQPSASPSGIYSSGTSSSYNPQSASSSNTKSSASNPGLNGSPGTQSESNSSSQTPQSGSSSSTLTGTSPNHVEYLQNSPHVQTLDSYSSPSESSSPHHSVSVLPPESSSLSQKPLASALFTKDGNDVMKVSLVFPQEKVVSALGGKSLSPGDVVLISMKSGKTLLGRVADAMTPITFKIFDPTPSIFHLRKSARVWKLNIRDFQDSECQRQFNRLLWQLSQQQG